MGNHRISHNLWRETGDIIRPIRSLQGRLRTLDHNDVQYLLYLIQENPDYFLDELLHLLKTNCFISVHYATIYHELERRGVNLKKLKRVAKERSEELRADFIRRMAQYGPEEIGFINETSKDEKTICRQYGQSRKGTRATKQQVFIQGRQTTITGLLSMDGLVAGTVVEGSMTKAMFMEFLEFIVQSCLDAGEDKGGVSGPGEVTWRKALRLNELAVGGRPESPVTQNPKVMTGRGKMECAAVDEGGRRRMACGAQRRAKGEAKRKAVETLGTEGGELPGKDAKLRWWVMSSLAELGPGYLGLVEASGQYLAFFTTILYNQEI
ncbi:hypothetical protein V8E52_009043 [Russula decolorans]